MSAYIGNSYQHEPAQDSGMLKSSTGQQKDINKQISSLSYSVSTLLKQTEELMQKLSPIMASRVDEAKGENVESGASTDLGKTILEEKIRVERANRVLAIILSDIEL